MFFFHQTFGVLFFLAYLIFVFFIFMNVFLAIIYDSYKEFKVELYSLKPRFEMGDFLNNGLVRIKVFTLKDCTRYLKWPFTFGMSGLQRHPLKLYLIRNEWDTSFSIRKLIDSSNVKAASGFMHHRLRQWRILSERNTSPGWKTVHRHRVKRHRVKRPRVKRQMVKNATKGKNVEKNILCIISELG